MRVYLSRCDILLRHSLVITYLIWEHGAAVMAGGHRGFGMGATPTAVMDMSALVTRCGPSPQAFMVVPVVGAFFINIVNAIILQGYIGVFL